MSNVTEMLARIEAGDRSVVEQLWSLVYDELREMAAVRMNQERSGQTLQATALVHEAYLRLIGNGDSLHWNSRGHFFSAAAEAMRRILVDEARRKKRLKRGGDAAREALDVDQLASAEPSEDLLALDEALRKLAAVDPQAEQLVNLRHFTGMSLAEAAEVLQISPRSADRLWAYARAWLRREIQGESSES